jgi:hypothetical protein
MKEYIYKEKIVTINKVKQKVIFPENHSGIDALFYKVVDLNAWDDWANITNWHTLCMILEKDKKKWKTIFNGSTRDFRINGLSIGNSGIFTILFQLEDEKIRNNFLKKAKIKELKNRIKEDTKRLQLLRKVKQ